jgi:hypothetical protein
MGVAKKGEKRGRRRRKEGAGGWTLWWRGQEVLSMSRKGGLGGGALCWRGREMLSMEFLYVVAVSPTAKG